MACVTNILVLLILVILAAIQKKCHAKRLTRRCFASNFLLAVDSIERGVVGKRAAPVGVACIKLCCLFLMPAVALGLKTIHYFRFEQF